MLTKAGEEHLTEYTYSDSLQLNTKGIPIAAKFTSPTTNP